VPDLFLKVQEANFFLAVRLVACTKGAGATLYENLGSGLK